LISNGQNLIPRKDMRKGFWLFGTDNNVVGPVVTENFIEKEFKCTTRDRDTTVTNSGLNSIMEIFPEFVGGDLGGRLVSVLFKKPYDRDNDPWYVENSLEVPSQRSSFEDEEDEEEEPGIFDT